MRNVLPAWKPPAKRSLTRRPAEVNVMEFNGALYLSVSGVPLLGIGDISGDLPSAVQAARENYKDWKEEELWERRGTTHAFTLF